MIAWPWYRAEINLQLFPHRTVAMLVGTVLTLSISYLTHWLFMVKKIDPKYDRWNAVVNARRSNNKRPTDDESDGGSVVAVKIADYEQADVDEKTGDKEQLSTNL